MKYVIEVINGEVKEELHAEDSVFKQTYKRTPTGLKSDTLAFDEQMESLGWNSEYIDDFYNMFDRVTFLPLDMIEFTEKWGE